jgi:hypothetical protein
MTSQKAETLALETYARRSYHYLSQMVDADNLPYFDIFWAEPAEAAHDWPDFGDVMSRQLQAAIMARHMTGEAVATEQAWHAKMLSYIDPASGLLYRPKTNYSEHVADGGDQSLTLYTLVTAYQDNHDPQLRRIILNAVNTLLERTRAGISIGQGFVGGFIIKSLMTCARQMESAAALELAGLLVKRVFEDEPLFTPDNQFLAGGHMHGNLRTLVGVTDYALYTHDAVLYSRADALYRYVRSLGTRFGFLPEADRRQGDIVSCETCALMDYVGLAVTLANHGHPEYWGDVERTVRNQLIENQVVDGSWLHSDAARPDTDQFTWRAIGERMAGGYAGWSSPTHILAARETLGAHWGGAELKNKTRAFQNCCGGSGTHAYFIAWKNASRVAEGKLSVNLLMDKLLPEAEIRSYQPYQGLLTIFLKAPLIVRVRIPEFTQGTAMMAEANGVEIPAVTWGNYLELGSQPAGTLLKISYPLPIYDEEVSIGNPGFRHYHYRATWKGDTVVKMEPLGNDDKTGYSDFDKQNVPIFYGEEGPGRLYQREGFLQDILPQPAPLHQDDGALDFWYFDASHKER